MKHPDAELRVSGLRQPRTARDPAPQASSCHFARTPATTPDFSRNEGSPVRVRASALVEDAFIELAASRCMCLQIVLLARAEHVLRPSVAMEHSCAWKEHQLNSCADLWPLTKPEHSASPHGVAKL
jgi:hypothetical protein